jgi:hypothetical protein
MMVSSNQSGFLNIQIFLWSVMCAQLSKLLQFRIDAFRAADWRKIRTIVRFIHNWSLESAWYITDVILSAAIHRLSGAGSIGARVWLVRIRCLAAALGALAVTQTTLYELDLYWLILQKKLISAFSHSSSCW